MAGPDLDPMEAVEKMGNPYLLRIQPQVCQACGELCVWFLIHPPKGGRGRVVVGKFCDFCKPDLAHAQE